MSDWQSLREKKLVTLQQYGRGQEIIRENDDGNSMFFIQSGEVVVYTHNAHGVEVSFRTLAAGQILGEVALLLNEPRSASARALSEVFAYELRQENFEEFLDAHPKMRRGIMEEMAHRLKSSGAILHDTVSPGIATEIEDLRTPTEKSVQRLVREAGSLRFLWANAILFACWIVANAAFLHRDTPEFAWLALFAAIEALLLSVLILAKQNRDETESNIRTDRILTNTKSAEVELKHLRQRVDSLHVDLLAVPTAPVPASPLNAADPGSTGS